MIHETPAARHSTIQLAQPVAVAWFAALVMALPASAASTHDVTSSPLPAADALVCFDLQAGTAAARTHLLAAGDSVQDAIDAAAPGDLIELAPGVYDGDVDFGGKAVWVRGAGPQTVLRGTGTGPVVQFTSGEGNGSVLDSVTVTGGNATDGGGILIANASPLVVRNVVRDNRAASRGSGIYVSGNSVARIYNNLVAYNRTTSGDPHGIQVSGADPVIVNNTVVRTDSNGLFVSSGGAALIMNNVIGFNGSLTGGSLRGRGICDFSGGATTIAYNDFYKNRIAALLRGGRDWKRIETYQRREEPAGITGNVDGRPRILRKPSSQSDRAHYSDFLLRSDDRSHATDLGNPHPSCNDLDGSTNDIGWTGGPFAPGSRALPGPGDCDAP